LFKGIFEANGKEAGEICQEKFCPLHLPLGLFSRRGICLFQLLWA